MTVTLKPLLNADAVIVEAGGDECFSGVAVGVGGCRRDVPLPVEAFPELPVRPADMLPESMAAMRFVEREIADGTGGLWARLLRGLAGIAWWARSVAGRSQDARDECAYDERLRRKFHKEK